MKSVALGFEELGQMELLVGGQWPALCRLLEHAYGMAPLRGHGGLDQGAGPQINGIIRVFSQIQIYQGQGFSKPPRFLFRPE